MAVLTALMLFAAQPAPELTAVAAQAGVDVVELEGALNTVGEPDPVRYLRHAGLLPWPAASVRTTIWDALAQCESGGNWSINAYHDGGLQFLPSTWDAFKPAGYPAFAYQASREQQIEVATRLQRAAGWGQWPVCSRRLGLR